MNPLLGGVARSDSGRGGPGWVFVATTHTEAFRFCPWSREEILPGEGTGPLHSAHNFLRIIGGGVPSRHVFYSQLPSPETRNTSSTLFIVLCASAALRSF